MRILMVAPEPFFAVRGTPISILSRLQALSAAGHQVDLVCYPHGDSIDIPGVTVYRTRKPIWIRTVPIGFSIRKLRLDMGLLVEVLHRLTKETYNLIFTHEEAVLLGAVINKFYGLPHLYDMHSSLPDNLANQGTLKNGGMIYKMARRVESWYLQNSNAVLAICGALSDRVKEVKKQNDGVWKMENLAIDDVVPPDPNFKLDDVRKRYQIAEDSPLCVYTGSASKVQGLELLLGAFRLWQKDRPKARLLMVGPGKKPFRGKLKRQFDSAGVVSVDPRPAEEMTAHMAAADVLASPRSHGANVPLKIYSYLKSNRPIVATNIAAHDPLRGIDRALLVPPEPQRFAGGLELGLGMAKQNSSPFTEEGYVPTPKQLRETIEEMLLYVSNRSELATL